MSESNNSIYLNPTLRLFLSADLIGSTAFKAERKLPEWLETFDGFLTGFPIYLKKECEDTEARGILSDCTIPIDSPRVWKRLGDEIIFEVTLSDHRQVPFFLFAFKRAVENYNKELRSEEKKGFPTVKATAWTAGFPVANAVIPIDRPSTLFDFIGPNMDIGFRLAKLTTDLRFTISVEVALLLAQAARPPKAQMEVHYSGKQSLRGVLSGRDYPHIWIKIAGVIQPIEEELLQAVDIPSLKAFCDAFLAGSPELIRPFIAGDSHFGRKPVDYDHRYAEVMRVYSQREEAREFD